MGRKSRRLSGCGPEEVVDSVPLVLPPKKRRTSLLVEDDRNEEKIEKKEAEKSENIPEIVVAPPAAAAPTDNNLEMIQEIDEEAANTSIDKTEIIEDKESDNKEASNLAKENKRPVDDAVPTKENVKEAVV